MKVLIIGYGDVAQRWAQWLSGQPCAPFVRFAALVRRAESAPQVRTAFGVPLIGDLDDFRKLTRLAGISDTVLYFAPPAASGDDDPRLRRALAALRGTATRFIYVSTTGVYGNCDGDWIDETRPVKAESSRAKRRVAAEQILRRRYRLPSVRLRVPGIYAADRLPLERIRAGTPALAPDDDAYSNHIHADDLARVVWLAAFRGKPHRAYNVVDGFAMKMGEWFDAVADAHGLPQVPKIPAAQLQAQVKPELWSFMRESRRIKNTRLRKELRVKLLYPIPSPRG